VDGVWVGRGPARFSRTRQEYDIYQLNALHPGVHLIAVLVQWAPNTRRSESDTPFLMSHIQGVTSQERQVTARTGPQWKALLSRTWRRDAVSVHSWGLIGPTELVDLQQLPRDWMLPVFSDDEWPAAVVKNLSDEPAYQPRSIPLLTNVPITPTVIDTGLLSPGRAIGELVPPISDPYVFPFEASKPTEFVVEILTGTETSPAGTVLLDSSDLDWKEANAHRPDVYVASTMVDTGAHSLSFAGIPPQGMTFGVSVHDIQPATLPFQQGVHAGRRLLLAEPVSRPDVVSISSGEGVTVEFTTTPAYVVLDLGRVIHGRLTASSIGPAGTVVDVGWDERLLTGTLRPLPYPGSLHPQWNQTDSWVLDGTARSISTIDARAGRYILIAVWGDSPIQLTGIRVFEERYPVAQRGWFESSSERLDKIWQIGVYTLYPNMTDAYTDTPWRERGQWWGDAYVEDHINRVAFGDTGLLRRGLLFMAEAFTDGRPPALAPNSDRTLLLDYGMLWVQSVHDYQQMTGDVQFLTRVYPALREFMTYLEGYENPDTGLLDVPFGMWWETALIDWGASDSRYGQSTAINALYFGTLLDAADIAEAVGAAADALVWRQEASFIKQQTNIHLYLSNQHQYVTSIFQSDVLSPTSHAQAWPLAYGLVPDPEIDCVVSSLLDLPHQVGLYGMFWVLEALGRAGRIPDALNIIKAYYSPLLDLGATTWWEVSDAHSRYTASLSHGWGGAPTWFLTTYVLGARRRGPVVWLVKPAFSGVHYASGSLPLQDGDLRIRWERQGCGENQLELTAPISTTGEIVIPFTNETAVLILNGHVVWREGTALTPDIIELADGIHISLQGGSYTLQVHQRCLASFLPAVFKQETANLK
jgi:alpha-L-rhamnosidase